MTSITSTAQVYTGLWQSCQVQADLLPKLEQIAETLCTNRGFYEKIEWHYPNLPWYWAGILHATAGFAQPEDFFQEALEKLRSAQAEQIPPTFSARLRAFDLYTHSPNGPVNAFVWSGTNHTKTNDSTPGCAAILYFLRALGLQDDEMERGSFTLKPTVSTVLKSCSMASHLLPSDQKVSIATGETLAVIGVAIAGSGHLRLTLKEPHQGHQVWFVFSQHVEVEGSRLTAPPRPKTLEEKIVAYCDQKGYRLDRGAGQKNIIYIEGMNADGTLNDNALNVWNDRRLVMAFQGDKPKIIGAWEATTNPGKYYTYKPMNAKGAAIIAFGQYTAWKVGVHLNSHEALVQRAPVTVHRDKNRSGSRDKGDLLDTGLFGINQHWGGDNPRSNIGRWSAGCQVGRTKQGHRDFMAMIKTDPRYKVNRDFMFTSTIISGQDLLAQFPD